jgi:predicted nucleic acid-binding protein
MSASAFFDTNVFVYAIVQDDPRSSRAEELLLEGGTVSVQVLNEFVAVVRRKISMPWFEVQFGLENIQRICPNPLPLTVQTHQKALSIAEKYGFQIYDALVVASALEAGCSVLYSEDMQDGQVIDHQLTVTNPFR